MTTANPSLRAQLITRRTYNRPTDDTGKNFETWEQTVDRVIGHQAWLWNRSAPDNDNQSELMELRQLAQHQTMTTRAN